MVAAARREIAEAYSLDEGDLAEAAHALAHEPAYLQHAGGVRPGELRDINQYSQQALFRHRPPSQHVDDELLLVTTL